MSEKADSNRQSRGFNFRQVEQDIRIAIAFLTRIPVPYPMDDQGNATDRSLAEASWAFPLVGILVGIVTSLVLILSFYLKLPLYVCALLSITAGILITGALHEDGLADVADGFGGSHKRDRKLEIMKDSQVGSYGVLALVISVLLRTLLLGSLLSLVPLSSISGSVYSWELLFQLLSFLIIAQVMGRGLTPLMMSHLPLARKEGLAATARKPKLRSSYASLLITLVLLFALLPFTGAAIVLLVSVMVLIGLSWLSLKQIGGYTGDVLGSGIQICEIFTYIALLSYIS